MNEQIKQIVNQAKENVPAGLAPEQWLEVYHQKLANLIVGECIALANKYAAGGAGSEFDVGYISCAETLAQEMKQHFQIEE